VKLINYFIFLFILAVACTNNTRASVLSILHEGEKDLGTSNKSSIITHSILYYPSEISLNFPGFIVGIEKSPKHNVYNLNNVRTFPIPDAGKKLDNLRKKIGSDSKLLYISHIVENFGDIYGEKNCAHYNAYYRYNQKEFPIDFCSEDEQLEIHNKDAFNKSWEALNILKNIINKKIKSSNYSHILVAIMGWNTSQEEAVRNFNSIIKNIKYAAEDGQFKPLFIGVTWPSTWQSDWATPLKTILSYPNKANDADEVGISWLGTLLHDTLNNLDKKIPIVVIGHSFGARSSSIATCIGPVISNQNEAIHNNTIDLLINLQGAYSINRFFKGKGIENLYYLGCKNAKHVILTSSMHDEAMDIKKSVPMVGNDKTYNNYCIETHRDNINCLTSQSNGYIQLNNRMRKHIIYINANNLIKYNSYLSGGGAHSDIYRRETGQMLWNIIYTMIK